TSAGEAAGAVATGPAPWFVEATERTGLDALHESGARGAFLMPEVIPPGVALFDADGDGDLDLYVTNGHGGLPDEKPPADAPPNRFFLQEPGLKFVDATGSSGLGDRGYGMGIAVGDVDNDGDADLYLSNYGTDRLFLNRGDGTFDDVTAEAGIEVGGWSTSAVFFDYDLDGFLDLYVARYVLYDPEKTCTDAAGRPDYCGPSLFPPAPDILLRNGGDGRFTDVSERAGIRSAVGPGLGVVAEDFDDDGWPDLYVANDAAANQLWLNRGDGTFRDAALMMGAAFNLEGVPEAGMGIVAEDLDGDLDLDLFVTHLDGETNTLYTNLGAGRGFDDQTGRAGLATDSVVRTGFGVVAQDAELDGDLDLFVVNGRVNRGERVAGTTMPAPWDEFAQRNLVFVNRGDGRFESGQERGGDFAVPVEVSRGLAAGDVDADGDVDLVVGNTEGPVRLYLNEAPREGRWLGVRATDPELGRDAIGARVTLIAGGAGQLRTIKRGGSYLSSSEPVARFGLPAGVEPEAVIVRWPGGDEERFAVAGTDRSMEVVRGDGEPAE
ncbi:MAG: CRTAC1 family protein, partial [Acidobacteriota bacterium]|nr:CRTAC1 family protein [Acidobacteriota bacterium]